MRSKEIEVYKQKLRLSDYQKEILVGLLLGDGHLETQNKELLGQKSQDEEVDEDKNDNEEKDSGETTTLDDLLNKTEKT